MERQQTMIEAATLSLRDVDSGDEALVIVRYDSKNVALCLSLRSGSDTEVVMTKDDARRVMEVLRRVLD
jgi:hypothetical protein